MTDSQRKTRQRYQNSCALAAAGLEQHQRASKVLLRMQANMPNVDVLETAPQIQLPPLDARVLFLRS